MNPTDQPIIIDLFAGGGGASEGIRMALGRDPDVAVNHDPKAIAMHKANHPGTLHVCQDVWGCPPRWAARGRKVAWLHASPDCTHHSKAKGGPPNRDEKRRDLAWVIEKWARELLPNGISLENVEEFLSWGPCDRHGVPIKSQAGASFRAFVRSLRALGYKVEWRELRACDYGAPTIRKRLFLIARRDGRPIVWPKPTHSDPKSPAVKSGKRLPWRTAAECIDWSIPCPSIFDRKRPLAENTLKRIAEGIRRYVLNAAQPFVVNLTHGGRLEDINDPIKTITAAHRGEKALVAPSLVQTGYGEREGQAPRALDLHAPLGTVVAGGQKHALVSAFLAKHYGGVVGHGLEQPIGSVTTVDHHSLVAASMVKMRGTNVGSEAQEPLHTISAQGQHHGIVAAHLQRDFGNSIGQPVDAPLGTVTAGGGGKAGLVYSFLQKYYGQGGQHSSPGDPMHTIPTKDRMGLVTVTIEGQPYVIADIGMRMLQPRELYLAQGFPDSYIIGDDPAQGLSLTKAEQVRMCGNSVCPPLLAALVAANYTEDFETAREGRELPLLAGLMAAEGGI